MVPLYEDYSGSLNHLSEIFDVLKRRGLFFGKVH